MIEAQEVELVKKNRVNEWVQLKQDFDYIIYRCKEKIDNAQSSEETQAAFVESMNNLIDLLKE